MLWQSLRRTVQSQHILDGPVIACARVLRLDGTAYTDLKTTSKRVRAVRAGS
jgi:hypothetical protein